MVRDKEHRGARIRAPCGVGEDRGDKRTRCHLKVGKRALEGV